LNIAFFSNAYLPVVSGVVRSIESFREALTKQGHNVFIFAQSHNGYEDTTPFIFRYPSFQLPIQADISAAIPFSPIVEQLLQFLKPEVIHTHHPILVGQAAARRAEELSIPLVFTFHTQYTEYTHYVPLPQEVVQEFLKGAIKNWLKEYMQRCQHIIIPSESMKEILVEKYGLRGQYTVIPTGINLEPYRHIDRDEVRSRMGWQEKTVLISTGRLAEEKNWPVLLESHRPVFHEHPDALLVIIGDGPEKESLEEYVRELNIADRVTFTGKLPFTDIPAYLTAADIFVFASVTETQGLVTMEAMAAGLPVVAVDASGTRDIVEDGKQGLLVPNDPDAMANAINDLLDAPEKRKKFKRNALKKAKTFDMENLAKQLVDVYKQAIADKAAGKYVTVEDEERKEQANAITH
jgi:1,2-diacylglycerol 3-alpha-glucosyltransferase